MKLVYSRIFAFLACFALLTPLSAEKLEGAQKKAVKKAQRMKVVEVVEDEGNMELIKQKESNPIFSLYSLDKLDDPIEQ